MTAAKLPLSRKMLYAACAAAGGLALLLGACESALRAAGYGYSPHFAQRGHRADGTAVWQENRWCTAPYFSPELVRRPQPFRIPVAKAADTCRIFVLGSSAAMGDPEPSFSLARMLEVMLRAAYPQRRFEVINAGITAINSHVVRGIAEDCAAMQPDLFIVYEGNNEVIGPFGPSGVFAPFLRSEIAIRLAVWAKLTRTGQALNALGRAIAARRRGRIEWGGMQMFLGQQVPARDPRLESVQAHFRANLRAIARSARAAGADTLLCTVVTNDRDFAPFLSLHRAGLEPAARARWDAEVAGAIAAERAHDAALAETHFRRALAIDDEDAELVFRLGRLALQERKPNEARALLQRARDLDALRFRTDSSLNQVIRDVAATAPGATLVDLAHDLAAMSAYGVPGDDLLYEHVHLTFRGTYEAAARLLPTVAAALERRGFVAAAPATTITLEEARERLAYTTYEQALIGHELLNRFRAPPFTGQIDDGVRIASWERRFEAANRLLANPQATSALMAIYGAAIARSPDDWVLLRNGGAMLVARHEFAPALPWLERATRLMPDDADTLVAYGLAERGVGRTAAAAATFARVRALEPRHPLLERIDRDATEAAAPGADHNAAARN